MQDFWGFHSEAPRCWLSARDGHGKHFAAEKPRLAQIHI
jgi:hypothetical protein